MKKGSEILLLMVGYTCNNNCIICSNRLIYTEGRKALQSDRTTDDIVDDLIKGKEDGYNKVEFTGGEPTVRPDILKLAQYAKDIGYKEIAVSTNGRLFSYNSFCDKAVSSGINRVTFTLYGPTASVHDAITRTPGSFEQTISGIKNVLKTNAKVTVNTVVTEMNFSHLKDVGNLLHNLNISVWSVIDLIPGSLPDNLYERIVVRIKEFSKSTIEIAESEESLSIQFFDFPFCVFSAKMREDKRFSFVGAKKRSEISKQVGYKPKRIEVIDNSYKDKHRKRTSVCNECIFENECGGVWSRYLEMFGEDEIKYLMKTNQCLRKDL